MSGELDEKQTLIDEIQRRISYLVTTDTIPDGEKVRIARKVLNLIEHGEKENVESRSAMYWMK